MQSTLTIFTVAICSHARARRRRIATYMYIHTYTSTGNFLVCMIYVGLAPIILHVQALSNYAMPWPCHVTDRT